MLQLGHLLMVEVENGPVHNLNNINFVLKYEYINSKSELRLDKMRKSWKKDKWKDTRNKAEKRL